MDVTVANAVAPFDAESEADGLILDRTLERRVVELINECVRGQGVEVFLQPPPPADRQAAIGGAPAQFPDVDALARDGLRLEVSGSPLDPPQVEEPPGYAEAEARCVGEQRFEDLRSQQETYTTVRGAWEDVLAEIEERPEVRTLAVEFSACLRDAGIAPEDSTDEFRFLASLDGLVSQASDRAEQEAILAQYGRLYADCGRELFEARERLRGGERQEFLAEHAAALGALSEAMYGGARPETP